MAEKVQIRGGTLDGSTLENAASEATLSKLVAALDKRGGTGSKVLEVHERTVKNNVTAMTRSTDNLSVFTGTLSNVNKNSKKLGESFARISTMAVGGILSGVATAGRTLLGFFTNSLDSFRETSQVGATFNNNLIELRRTAAASAMPLEMFTEMIKNNSITLAAFGGTVTAGAQRFADLSKQLRTGDLGQRFMGMGMTMSDLNEYMASYLEIEMKAGRLRDRSDAELLEGTQNYIKEIDRLAKITGQTRRQAADAASQARADVRLSIQRRRLDGENAANFDQTFSALRASVPTEVFNTLANMSVGVIHETDEFAHALAAAVPGIQELMQQAAAGTITQEEVMKRLGDAGPLLRQFGDRSGPAAAALLEVVAAAERFSSSFDRLGQMNTRGADAEQARRHTITEALGSFAQTMEKIKGDITLALIDSGVFERVLNGLSGLATLFTDNADKIGPAVTKLIDEFDQFMTRFLDKVNTDGVASAIGDFLKGLLSRMFSRATPEQQARQQANTEQLGTVRQERSRIQTEMSALQQGPSSVESMDRIEALQRDLDRLSSQRERLISENNQIADATRSGLFSFSWSTLTDNIGGLGLAAAGIVGSAALFGGALRALVAPLTALTPAIPTILAFGAAIGMGGYGLGQVLQGVAGVIEQVARAFDMLPTSLKKFEEIDPARIREIGPALRTLTGPLMESGLAGILARLGGDGGLPTLARSLQGINQIDSSNIRNLASGLSDLKSTIGQDFANQARNVDTFAGSIRVLTSALAELNREFQNLNTTRSGGSSALQIATRLGAAGAAGAGAGTAATTEMLAEQRRLNTLIEGLRPVFEATRDNTKNVADGVSGRNNPL